MTSARAGLSAGRGPRRTVARLRTGRQRRTRPEIPSWLWAGWRPLTSTDLHARSHAPAPVQRPRGAALRPAFSVGESLTRHWGIHRTCWALPCVAASCEATELTKFRKCPTAICGCSPDRCQRFACRDVTSACLCPGERLLLLGRVHKTGMTGTDRGGSHTRPPTLASSPARTHPEGPSGHTVPAVGGRSAPKE